jgi:hypothetical protein
VRSTEKRWSPRSLSTRCGWGKCLRRVSQRRAHAIFEACAGSSAEGNFWGSLFAREKARYPPARSCALALGEENGAREFVGQSSVIRTSPMNVGSRTTSRVESSSNKRSTNNFPEEMSAASIQYNMQTLERTVSIVARDIPAPRFNSPFSSLSSQAVTVDPAKGPGSLALDPPNGFWICRPARAIPLAVPGRHSVMQQFLPEVDGFLSEVGDSSRALIRKAVL